MYVVVRDAVLGHLDSRRSIQRVLAVTFAISFAYSMTQVCVSLFAFIRHSALWMLADIQINPDKCYAVSELINRLIIRQCGHSFWYVSPPPHYKFMISFDSSATLIKLLNQKRCCVGMQIFIRII